MKNNYIPHETSTFDNRDPLWMNKGIKQLPLEKNKTCKYYL